MTPTSDNDSNDPAGLEVIAVPKTTLDELLRHAAFAAHHVGHLDDDKHADLIGQLGDHMDAVVHGLTEILGEARTFAAHGLTEILGEARTFAAPDPALPDVAHDGTPMLVSGAGGAP